MTGTISITRILRVCQQRWVTIMVFVIIGFVASYAVFKISPVIYEAKSIIEMRMRSATYTGVRSAVIEVRLSGLTLISSKSVKRAGRTWIWRLSQEMWFGYRIHGTKLGGFDFGVSRGEKKYG